MRVGSGIREMAGGAVVALLLWVAPIPLPAQTPPDSLRGSAAHAPIVQPDTSATCEERLARATRQRHSIIRRATWLGAAAGTAVFVGLLMNTETNTAGPLVLLVTPMFAVPAAGAAWLIASFSVPVPEPATHCQPPTTPAPSP